MTFPTWEIMQGIMQSEGYISMITEYIFGLFAC